MLKFSYSFGFYIIKNSVLKQLINIQNFKVRKNIITISTSSDISLTGNDIICTTKNRANKEHRKLLPHGKHRACENQYQSHCTRNDNNFPSIVYLYPARKNT